MMFTKNNCFSKNLSQVPVFCAVSHSEKGTQKIAKKAQKYIKTGDFVVLDGDLGAGKSVFVRAFLRLKGVKSAITSPTFTIMNEHFGKNGAHFFHFDMYRLGDENEVQNFGFDDIVDDANSTKFVEWAQNVSSHLPKHFKKIVIEKLSDSTRKISLFEVQNDKSQV